MRAVCGGVLAFALMAAPAMAQEASALPDPLAAGWQGEQVCTLLHDLPDQRILRCTFPPGVGHDRHYHVRHVGYALSGGTMRLTDATGTRVARIEAGSSYESDGTAWHEVLNIGDTTVTYLIIEPRA